MYGSGRIAGRAKGERSDWLIQAEERGGAQKPPKAPAELAGRVRRERTTYPPRAQTGEAQGRQAYYRTKGETERIRIA